LPLGARAVQIANGASSTYFLTTFGRASRETVCSCEVKMEPTLSQSLHLMNGDTVNQKIAAGGLIQKRLAEKKQPSDIIEELYTRTLSRRPTPEELRKLCSIVMAEADRTKALEDVFWGLLNSREFMFNH
jgi:Asp-tRNA(Asn)/Glu-tRNA(Gln) amidotransferase B subunit